MGTKTMRSKSWRKLSKEEKLCRTSTIPILVMIQTMMMRRRVNSLQHRAYKTSLMLPKKNKQPKPAEAPRVFTEEELKKKEENKKRLEEMKKKRELDAKRREEAAKAEEERKAEQDRLLSEMKTKGGPQ